MGRNIFLLLGRPSPWRLVTVELRTSNQLIIKYKLYICLILENKHFQLQVYRAGLPLWRSVTIELRTKYSNEYQQKFLNMHLILKNKQFRYDSTGQTLPRGGWLRQNFVLDNQLNIKYKFLYIFNTGKHTIQVRIYRAGFPLWRSVTVEPCTKYLTEYLIEVCQYI